MASVSQKRHNSKALVIWGVVGVILIALWLCWRMSILGRAPSELKEQLLLAKQDGLPLDGAEMRSMSSIRPDENAAPLVIQALTQLKSWKESEAGKQFAKISDQRGGVVAATPQQLSELRPLLPGLVPTVQLLTEAVRRPRMDFNRDWEKGPSLLFPEFSDEKSAAQALLLKARIDAADGKMGSALDSIDTVAKFSNLVGQDPILIGALVEVAIRSLVFEALEPLVRAHSSDPQVLGRAPTILADLGPIPDLRPAIRAEFLMARTAVQMMAKPQGAQMFGSESDGGVMRLARLPAVRTVYELRVIESYRAMYRTLSQNYNSAIGLKKTFSQADQNLQKKSTGDWTYGLANIICPVFTNAAVVVGESEARRNVWLSAIDVLAQKQKTGKFPSVALGTSGHWLDPFTGKPLIYRPTAKGFVVYSVGPDEKDDGGKPRAKNGADMHYDIPFAFPE